MRFGAPSIPPVRHPFLAPAAFWAPRPGSPPQKPPQGKEVDDVCTLWRLGVCINVWFRCKQWQTSKLLERWNKGPASDVGVGWVLGSGPALQLHVAWQQQQPGQLPSLWRSNKTTRDNSKQSWSRHEVVFVGNVCTCCLPLCYLRGKNGKIPPVASYLGEFGPRLLESILRESARTELLLASLSNHDIIKMFVASFGLKYRRQIWRIEDHKLRLIWG